jgi:hypothetical protein
MRMRIGFAGIYPWRPHSEHLFFVAELARKAGHEAHFLACDSDLPACYARLLRGRPGWLECLQCRAGGIRSFPAKNVTSIGSYSQDAAVGEVVPEEWAESSASTLGRFESDVDYASEEFRTLKARLSPAVQLGYVAARNWISTRRLDALCVFNGRMDVTRAIFEAGRSLAVPVVSLERTWFGDGLQLYPDENCLGLRSVHALVTEWKERPLKRDQALRAAGHIAARFLRTNNMEWRAYNTQAKMVPWPIASAGRKILLVPSSRNEIWGHPDWASGWPDPLAAYDALISHLRLRPNELVMRCHPNWAQRIGSHGGERSERYYTKWARGRGVHVIPSADPTSTLGLIEECDALVMASGSAALEAGLIGKQVIGTAGSPYARAGLRDDASSAAELSALRLRADLAPGERAARERATARQTLRFCYTMAYRVAQYTRFVKAEATTRYHYDLAADGGRFISLLRGGALLADDDACATDCAEEDEVLELIDARKWTALRTLPSTTIGEYAPLRRRFLARPIDLISRWKPVGGR